MTRAWAPRARLGEVLPRPAGLECVEQEVVYRQPARPNGSWGDLEWVGFPRSGGPFAYCACPVTPNPSEPLTRAWLTQDPNTMMLRNAGKPAPHRSRGWLGSCH